MLCPLIHWTIRLKKKTQNDDQWYDTVAVLVWSRRQRCEMVKCRWADKQRNIYMIYVCMMRVPCCFGLVVPSFHFERKYVHKLTAHSVLNLTICPLSRRFVYILIITFFLSRINNIISSSRIQSFLHLCLSDFF